MGLFFTRLLAFCLNVSEQRKQQWLDKLQKWQDWKRSHNNVEPNQRAEDKEERELGLWMKNQCQRGRKSGELDLQQRKLLKGVGVAIAAHKAHETARKTAKIVKSKRR